MQHLTDHWVWIALVLGYLAGSIPFGLILTRMAGTEDLRSIGSGNIGATNVLRTGRKGLAAATLLLDALKGTAAVLFARHYFGVEAAAAAGLGAFLGHLYPVWLGFKGGKGVATYLGVILALAPVAFLVFAVCWLAAAFLTRYSSLAALVGAVAAPLSVLAAGDMTLAAFLGILTLLVFWKHRPNIQRLMAGTESRIGQKG
ncbi:MAG: glycerol-3-phosphate 1-O-acyltransferase PlsY [Rhizobiaceae bacterium]|jgi:glycerol-3-phosphate acyltransferase PlsY|nr:glycerol-3-phosphate 1-O-acyltransferase PlsY [Rhizobiaceae bacterium]